MMWQIVEDIPYMQHLISIYSSKAEDDLQVYIRTGNGMDDQGNWLDPIHVAYAKSFSSCLDVATEYLNEIYL